MHKTSKRSSQHTGSGMRGGENASSIAAAVQEQVFEFENLVAELRDQKAYVSPSSWSNEFQSMARQKRLTTKNMQSRELKTCNQLQQGPKKCHGVILQTTHMISRNRLKGLRSLLCPIHRLQEFIYFQDHSMRELLLFILEVSNQRQIFASTSQKQTIHYKQLLGKNALLGQMKLSWSMWTQRKKQRNSSKLIKDKFSKTEWRSDGPQRQRMEIISRHLWVIQIICTGKH